MLALEWFESRIPQVLNKFQNFVIKDIQWLKISTRTDMCERMRSIFPIISEIDRRCFFGKLCNLDTDSLTKKKSSSMQYDFLNDDGRPFSWFLKGPSSMIYYRIYVRLLKNNSFREGMSGNRLLNKLSIFRTIPSFNAFCASKYECLCIKLEIFLASIPEHLMSIHFIVYENTHGQTNPKKFSKTSISQKENDVINKTISDRFKTY